MTAWKWRRGLLPEISMDIVADLAMTSKQPIQVVLDSFKQIRAEETIWMNDLYQVNIRKVAQSEYWPAMMHLSIKRRDKQPLGKERFRHFQRIKNELVGPECEAVELYPAESRLVDTANQYHLWCMTSPEIRFPFGYLERSVNENMGGGSVQEPFEKDK
jgi:hypothetical protein